MKIKYEEDTEDVEFPPVKYSPDLIYVDPNENNNSCLNKLLRIFKNKTYLILTIVGIIIVIIAIILIAVLTSKKNKSIDEKKINDNIWNGGSVYITISNPNLKEKEVILFNNENIGLNKEDFSVEYLSSNKLRNLDEDNNKVNIVGNKFNLIDTINDNYLSFEIKFKEELNSMKEMFKNNNDLLSIDLSFLKSDKINNMHSTFLNCNNLENINFTNFDSKNINIMDSIFENCSSLTVIDLSCFETNNLNSMTKAFKNCNKLKNLNLKNFNLNNNINISEAFDLLGEKTFIVINGESIDIIKNIGNVQIINTDKNCTENIENCKTCDKDNLYICDICQEGYTKLSDSLECIKENLIIPTTIIKNVITPQTTIINKIPQTTINVVIPTIPKSQSKSTLLITTTIPNIIIHSTIPNLIATTVPNIISTTFPNIIPTTINNILPTSTPNIIPTTINNILPTLVPNNTENN